MGKPSAPDPVRTANAQTQSNKDTATANANLNRIDQYTPFGSSTYKVIGTNPDGTPQYQQTTEMSAPIKGIFDSQVANQQQQQNISSDLLGNVNAQYSKPIDVSGVNQLNSGLNASQLADLNSRYVTSAGAAPTAASNTSQAGYARAGQSGAMLGTAGQAQASNAQASGAQAFNAQAGQSQAMQTGTAQAGTGPYVTTAGNGGGNIQRNIDIGSVPSFIKGAQDAAYTNQMAYLNPQFANEQSNLESKLAAQGITQGSAAWDRAQSELSRNQTFQQQQAQNAAFNQGLQGGQTAFGMLLGQGQFANQAQQQGYDQSYNNAQLANHAADAATQTSQFNAGQANQVAMANADRGTQNSQFNAGQQTQVNLANAGANTATSQFNAGQNTAVSQSNADRNTATSQFNAGQQTQANLANADRVTSNNQFNAGQQSATSQFNAGQTTQNNQFNAGLQTSNNQFNAAQAQQQAQYNAGLNNSAVNNQFGNAMTNAGVNNAAHGQGMTDTFAVFNQPMNTYNQLQTGAQATMPTFAGVPQVGMAPTDVAGIINNGYANQVGAYNGTMQGLGQLGGSAMMAYAMSDKRLKENIEKVGQTPAGNNVYSYNYKGDKTPQVGVLAQELLKKQPEAVVRTPSGFLAVNYAKVA